METFIAVLRSVHRETEERHDHLALTGPHARRAGMGAQSESNCVNAAGNLG